MLAFMYYLHLTHNRYQNRPLPEVETGLEMFSDFPETRGNWQSWSVILSRWWHRGLRASLFCRATTWSVLENPEHTNHLCSDPISVCTGHVTFSFLNICFCSYTGAHLPCCFTVKIIFSLCKWRCLDLERWSLDVDGSGDAGARTDKRVLFFPGLGDCTFSVTLHGALIRL